MHAVVLPIPFHHKPVQAPTNHTPCFPDTIAQYLRSQSVEEISVFLPEAAKGRPEGIWPEGIGFQFLNAQQTEEIAGRIEQVMAGSSDDFFVLMEGTRFHNCDLGMLTSQFLAKKPNTVAALRFVRDSAGVVSLDADGRILPNESGPALREGYSCCGTFAVRKGFLPQIQSQDNLSMAEQLLRGDGCLGLPLPAPLLCGPETSQPQRKALFLDRDGVINKDTEYLHKSEDVQFCDGIFEFCQKATAKGYSLVVITNQSGIARGYYPESDVTKLHAWMKEQFRAKGVDVLDFFTCPYYSKGTVAQYTRRSLLRKPEPGMILTAAEKWNINLAESIMIGDKPSDRIKLPCLRSYVLKSKYAESGFDFVSLQEAGAKLL